MSLTVFLTDGQAVVRNGLQPWSEKFKVQSSRFKVQGSKFKVQSSRFKVSLMVRTAPHDNKASTFHKLGVGR